MDESSEKPTQTVSSREVSHKLTRRGFLGKLVTTGLGAVGLAVGGMIPGAVRPRPPILSESGIPTEPSATTTGTPIPVDPLIGKWPSEEGGKPTEGGGISPGAVPVRPPILSESGIPIPEVLPQDILTEEELKKNHIEIEYTSKDPDLKLFLRKSVLDLLPVFQDARDGKISGIVITLMKTVSWNEIYKLSEESRSLAEALMPIPPKLDEDLLGTRKEELEGILNSIYYFSPKPASAEAKKLLEEFDRINDKDPAYAHVVSFLKEEILNRPLFSGGLFMPPQTLDHMLKEFRNNLKVEDWIIRHFDGAQKVRIWLTTGDPNESHQEGSFPSPDKYIVNPPDAKGYLIDPFQPTGKGNPVPGDLFTYPSVRSMLLRHEAGHYKGPGETRSEDEADQSAYDSLVAAWNKFQESGDTSGYPFYFVDKRGRISVAQKSSPNTKNV